MLCVNRNIGATFETMTQFCTLYFLMKHTYIFVIQNGPCHSFSGQEFSLQYCVACSNLITDTINKYKIYTVHCIYSTGGGGHTKQNVSPEAWRMVRPICGTWLSCPHGPAELLLKSVAWEGKS